MTKTLADMTPEERAVCAGMWCDYLTPCGIERAIYSPAHFFEGETLFEPGYGHFEVEDLSHVTPRFDLPRAWNPVGSPLQATRETITGCDGMRLGAPDGDSFLTTPGTIYQRWIIDWQEVE